MGEYLRRLEEVGMDVGSLTTHPLWEQVEKNVIFQRWENGLDGVSDGGLAKAVGHEIDRFRLALEKCGAENLATPFLEALITNVLPWIEVEFFKREAEQHYRVTPDWVREFLNPGHRIGEDYADTESARVQLREALEFLDSRESGQVIYLTDHGESEGLCGCYVYSLEKKAGEEDWVGTAYFVPLEKEEREVFLQQLGGDKLIKMRDGVAYQQIQNTESVMGTGEILDTAKYVKHEGTGIRSIDLVVEQMKWTEIPASFFELMQLPEWVMADGLRLKLEESGSSRVDNSGPVQQAEVMNITNWPKPEMVKPEVVEVEVVEKIKEREERVVFLDVRQSLNEVWVEAQARVQEDPVVQKIENIDRSVSANVVVEVKRSTKVPLRELSDYDCLVPANAVFRLSAPAADIRRQLSLGTRMRYSTPFPSQVIRPWAQTESARGGAPASPATLARSAGGRAALTAWHLRELSGVLQAAPQRFLEERKWYRQIVERGVREAVNEKEILESEEMGVDLETGLMMPRRVLVASQLASRVADWLMKTVQKVQRHSRWYIDINIIIEHLDEVIKQVDKMTQKSIEIPKIDFKVVRWKLGPQVIRADEWAGEEKQVVNFAGAAPLFLTI